jgi:hypothetical protein
MANRRTTTPALAGSPASIERDRLAPLAVAFDELDEDPEAVRYAPQLVDLALGAVAPLSLLVLEAVAERGGRIHEEELDETLGARHGLGSAAIRAAVDQLRDASLLFVYDDERNEPMLALISTTAELIADRILGVSVEWPAADAVAEETLASTRALLAVVTLAAHRPCKAARYGANRTSLRIFSKGLGVELAQIGCLLDRALRVGMCVVDEQRRISPHRELLERCAHGTLLTHLDRAMLEKVAACLDTVPVPREAVIRAIVAQHRLERASSRYPGYDDSRSHADRAGSALDYLVGIRRFTQGGIATVARTRACRLEAATGDGEVTSGFEVKLGPAADLPLVVRIGLCAELVGLDRVLTFRLTEASIRAGLDAGLGTDEIVAALGQVGAQPAPATVVAAITGWARGHAPRPRTDVPVDAEGPGAGHTCGDEGADGGHAHDAATRVLLHWLSPPTEHGRRIRAARAAGTLLDGLVIDDSLFEAKCELFRRLDGVLAEMEFLHRRMPAAQRARGGLDFPRSAPELDLDQLELVARLYALSDLGRHRVLAVSLTVDDMRRVIDREINEHPDPRRLALVTRTLTAVIAELFGQSDPGSAPN